jgi:hypothetical protein
MPWTRRTHAAISSPHASLRLGANEVMRLQAEAERGRLVFVSPFGRAEQRRALRGARSAHQPLTSGGCLNAAAAGRVVSSARPAKTEQRKAALATRGPRRQGSLLCPLSCRYKKGGRPPGRTPGADEQVRQKYRREAARAEQGFDTSARTVGAGRTSGDGRTAWPPATTGSTAKPAEGSPAPAPPLAARQRPSAPGRPQGNPESPPTPPPHKTRSGS